MAGNDLDKNKRLEESMDGFADEFLSEFDNEQNGVNEDTSDNSDVKEPDTTSSFADTDDAQNDAKEVVNAFDIINSKEIKDADYRELDISDKDKDTQSTIENIQHIKNEETVDATDEVKEVFVQSPSTMFEEAGFFGDDTTTLPDVVPEMVTADDTDLIFTTFSLAKELDVTPQTIRNYADYFDEFLSNEKGGKGQKVFNSQDLAILRKIQELRFKQYSRADIKKIFKERGVASNKIVNRDINIPHEGGFEINKNEVTQLGQHVIQSVTQELQQYIEKGLGNIEENFLQNLKSFTESLEETIKKQNALISDQKKEIDGLKSILGNVNRTTINTDKALKEFSDSSSSLSANTKREFEEMRKDLGSRIDKIESGGNAEGLEKLKDEMLTENNKASKAIIDSVNDTNEKIRKVSDSINKLSQNNANSQGSNNIRKDIKNALDNNYVALKKVVDSSSAEQLQKIEELINSSVSAVPVREQGTDPESEAAILELQNKYASAEKTIRNLALQNADLQNKYKESKEASLKKDDEINALKNKVTDVVVTAKHNIESLNQENRDLKKKYEIAKELAQRNSSAGGSTTQRDTGIRNPKTQYRENPPKKHENVRGKYDPGRDDYERGYEDEDPLEYLQEQDYEDAPAPSKRKPGIFGRR